MKRKNIVSIFACLSLLLFSSGCTNTQQNNVLNLAGTWSVQLDPDNKGEKQEWYNTTFKTPMQLPGTTDEAKLGQPEIVKDPYNALVRPHYYVGKAWYQREIEIPQNWEEKNFILLLERCHWITKVWVNNQYVGTQNSLCAAHEYDLSSFLYPGKHTLTICVNNKYPFTLGGFASSVSEHTQSNWNGIVGRIELQVKDKVWMEDLRIYPDVNKKQAKVVVNIKNTSGVSGDAIIDLLVCKKGETAEVASQTINVSLKKGKQIVGALIDMGEDVELWDEFTPTLYNITASLKSNDFIDEYTTNFGMREVGVDNTIFTINGKRTYMRGNLECCIFPLTGYPSMDTKSWVKILRTQKEIGMNHVRFHSWCPPKAAFDAADIVGMYIQAEAPRANVNNEPIRDKFIQNELLLINKAYGNNPSFMFMSGGNELSEDEEEDPVNVHMIATAMKDDNRHLYTTTSGGRGMDHKQSRSNIDQYRVGGARGFYKPGTAGDHREYYTKCPWASLTHEVGQHGVYPNMDEISKYTGVLKPVNLEAIKNDLKAKGMLDLAPAFLDATARHAAIMYKEEIEILMRTEGHAGFQLLSLHDYPGQGTAHVGLFDAFWDNKGGITPEEFRKFNAPTVALLRMPKRTYSNNEPFKASAEILNYGPGKLNQAQPFWKITNETGEVLKNGKFDVKDIPQGERVALGEIEVDLSFVQSASKLSITVGLEGVDCENSWDVWCYTAEKAKVWPSDIVVRRTLDNSVKKALAQGKKVLLLPAEENLKNSLKGNPKSVFWSPTWWFTKPRGGNTTMSVLCNPAHPVFKSFPTEQHSNWQWWSLKKNSNTIVLDTLQTNIEPIIRVIDNYGRNHKLASLLEVKVGKGSLMICSMDIERNLGNRPEAIQMRNSILSYMGSENFAPKQELPLEQLALLFK
ncbi:sugar-binding domain-containing protein [Labilibacter marinus]|uniref:sugar-binding domain-containing protein n=1 Tax=Labilibacter marinus TaxID=1477105 RepID=UPI00094F648B|nr:sugar-binding domain-containing protein [Labilibacter marinus]